MKNKVFLMAVLLTLLSAEYVSGSAYLVPKPAEMTMEKGQLHIDGRIDVYAHGKELHALCGLWFQSTAKPYEPGIHEADEGFTRIVSQTRLPVMKMVRNRKNANLILSLDGSLGAEEYSLDINEDAILISGGGTAGVWWGLQTLTQLLVQNANSYDGIEGITLPCLSIRDYPLLDYRGAMLDCARHFFPVDKVKEFIDLMVLHKLNVFHWHLTDDQGWRIEIKKYPRLTEVGSVRKETLIGHIQRSKKYDGTPYGGYYTQDDIREVVAYAAARNVSVVPEIDMPGHSQALLAAYPQLGCKGDGYEVRTTWGISNDVVCVGNEDTFRFFCDILDEVVSLFPSEIIHIGGDEVRFGHWQNCPRCQGLKQKLGLETEKQLQGHFIAEVEAYLKTKGRKILGWDEILSAGVTPSAMVMSWRGPAGGIRAARMGNEVVMAPNSHFYLNYYQTKDYMANKEPLSISGALTMEKCYSFEPFDGLDENGRKCIKGLQANLWTEYIASFDKAQYMLLPRLAALSEIAWSREKDDYDSFMVRVRNGFVPEYQYFGLIYAPYAFRTANFDEAKIPGYTLPDVLKTKEGRNISTVRQWEKHGRPEILSDFTHRMYGTLPQYPVQMDGRVLEESADAVDGKAVRKQVELTFSYEGRESKVLLLIYLPKNKKNAVPCFLGLNFQGNGTVSCDPAIIPSQYTTHPRGNRAGRWDVEKIIDAGYALVTAHYYDFFYDREDVEDDSLYMKSMPRLFGKTRSAYASDEGKAISAWAWGYSRILDYIIKEEGRIDGKKVAVLGHSRLGKAALWAGANDGRFALVISNDSGCCGSALTKRRIGEDLNRIMRFNHWFCSDFYQYKDNEEALDFDQHELMALIAPRPLYIASAIKDRYADPRGEFLAACEASAVYGLYGLKGIEKPDFPLTGHPVNDGAVGYHVREGGHDVTSEDWKYFIEFADRHIIFGDGVEKGRIKR